MNRGRLVQRLCELSSQQACELGRFDDQVDVFNKASLRSKDRGERGAHTPRPLKDPILRAVMGVEEELPDLQRIFELGCGACHCGGCRTGW